LKQGHGLGLAASIIALTLCGNLSPALAQLQDENLLTSLPRGFVVGDTQSNGREDMAEYVPTGESVNDWSRMVTVQIFHGLANADTEAFAGKLETGWKSACPGGNAKKIKTGAENGYPFSLWVFNCALNPETNKPETMFLKAIGGGDALYSAQYAFRSLPSKDKATAALGYLVEVSACDTRRKDRPCPPGM
jgi:hypothetical protein